MFSPSFRKQVAVVRSIVPPGSRLLHVSHEGYIPASWQRALYPGNPVRFVFQPRDIEPSSLQEIRKHFGARYAISAGDPPVDPGFLWYRVLEPIPGTGQTWFGEIAP